MGPYRPDKKICEYATMSRETIIMFGITILAGFLGTRDVVSTLAVAGWLFLFSGMYFEQFWTSAFGGMLALATMCAQRYQKN